MNLVSLINVKIVNPDLRIVSNIGKLVTIRGPRRIGVSRTIDNYIV